MEQMTMELTMPKKRNVKMKEDELIYPISINYGKKDWNAVSSLREFLANMLDTKAEYSFKYVNGFAIIEDSGKGLSKKDFIFGESSKDESDIGQFGEGLKMSLIQLLRENRKSYIKSVGFSVEASKAYSDVYDSEVMLLKFDVNNRKIGTQVSVECTNEEFEEAVSLFLLLNPNMSKIDQNVYLPEGRIFIAGLDTNKLPNTIFSYNIEDKSMTNRDRNIVAAQKLNANLVSILRKMKNQKAILEFLRHLETDPGKYEYQLPVNPVYKDVWKKAFDKLYSGKAVLSSDLKSDLHAKMMGYIVLRNIPHYMNALLKSLGVALSEVVARDYKGQSLFEGNRMVYPISSDYCSNWTVVDAIREIIANAIDTGSKVRVEYSSGKCRIYDSGDGIMKKHLIFGISEKSKSDIGQFGEGLKVSSLVLVRNKRQVQIQTKGYNYTPALERFEEYESNLFTVHFEKNQRTKGTLITFDASEAEVNKAKDLFTYFKDDRKKPLTHGALDVYSEDPGIIYVNGLKTQTINSLFGYNITDKTFVNSRDRNSVDSFKLKTLISQFFMQTDNAAAIEAFLWNWTLNRSHIEYEITFKPINLNVWRTVAKKIFKTACLSSYNDKHNFIAKQAGYTILRNIPASIHEIFREIKIETADDIAKKYENKGIIFSDEIIYPIASDYCSNWTVVDAIKELLSNSLDTETEVSASIIDDVITISDKGDGIEKKNFLFSSSKKDDTKIGMFGEGLKIAMLVLARNNRKPEIKTSGVIYRAVIKRDMEFGADVLVIKIEPSKKMVGTKISFMGNEYSLNLAKTSFLRFNKNMVKQDEQIYTLGGSVFVNGVLITSMPCHFSYDLKNEKGLISRDRKTINQDLALKQIESILSKASSPKVIYDILTCNLMSHLEENLNVRLIASVKPLWKKEANALFPKSCLSTGMEYDYAAIDRGYTILNNLTMAQKNILLQLGFQHSKDVVTLMGDESVVKKRMSERNLSPGGKIRYKKAKKIFKSLYGIERASMIELVEEFNSQTVADGTLGFYNQNNQKIYILKDLFDNIGYEFYHAIGVLIHEEVHHMSGASDRSREFENALTWEIGKLAEIYIK